MMQPTFRLLPGNSRKHIYPLAAALSLLLVASPLASQAIPPAPMIIDASAPTPPAAPASYTFVADEARSPGGHVLGLNSEYLTLDGKPWLPVMGEMHYTRVPEAEWESEILKMKSAGVQIIATYLIWIHHEEVEGEWDWTGQKDLRHFVELCAKHGMYVVPRVGPWSHAEVRNGGFPDWLLTKAPNLRSNDPAYLKYVDLYYRQIGEQLKGLMWNQGGPVVAIQLENEYGRHGPLQGPDHILKLKQMARDAGLKVPFYTETGWDNAAIPAGEVLTVDGGYPDAPWDASIDKLQPSGVYAFRLGRRAFTNDMGAIGVTPTPAASSGPNRNTPPMTAEMGGGMQVTYHRRTVVTADDVAAMMPVMLGNGFNLYGTYMFHGGENPDGKLTTLQESLATHYANDLPVKSYDFQAPIGEFGDERESLRKLKSWNYFLNDFGASLAPMQPRRPDISPKGPGDFTVPRIIARTSGSSGFLFVNNHVREYPMPARTGFQVAIKLPAGETLILPSQPVTLPPDAYFVWPFHMDLSGLQLRFATAQPLAILGTKDAPIYAFFAQPGIPAEFVIDDMPNLRFDEGSLPAAMKVTRQDNAIWLHFLRGPTLKVRFTLPGGAVVTLLLLEQENAENGWKIKSGGDTELLVTKQQQAFVDGDTATLQNLGEKNFNVLLLPGIDSRLVSTDPRVRIVNPAAGNNYFTPPVPKASGIVRLNPRTTRRAGQVAPLPPDFKPSSRPRVVAAAPAEADWSRAGVWSIALPRTPPAADEQRFLRIHYAGDVARISAGDHLLTDDFSTGQPWLIGLRRFTSPLQQVGNKLNLSIYPLRQNAPIFFEPGSLHKFDGPQAVSLQSVELLTQYTLKLKLETVSIKKP